MTNTKDPARLIRWQRITIAVLLCGLALSGVVIKSQMRRAATAERNAERRMQTACAVANTLWENDLRLERDHALDQLSLHDLGEHLNRYERKYGEIDPPSQPVDHWAYTSTLIQPDLLTLHEAGFAAQRFVRTAIHLVRPANDGEAPAKNLLSLGFGFTVANTDMDNSNPDRWLVTGTVIQNEVPLRWRVVEHRDHAGHWDAESVRIGLR